VSPAQDECVEAPGDLDEALPVSTTHCSNNYGPYQHEENFIPTVVRRCLEGADVPVYGNGSNIRDGGTYNVGGTTNGETSISWRSSAR
jgi:dTDP-D-glucose 4,6-dehydratase